MVVTHSFLRSKRQKSSEGQLYYKLHCGALRGFWFMWKDLIRRFPWAEQLATQRATSVILSTHWSALPHLHSRVTLYNPFLVADFSKLLFVEKSFFSPLPQNA